MILETHVIYNNTVKFRDYEVITLGIIEIHQSVWRKIKSIFYKWLGLNYKSHIYHKFDIQQSEPSPITESEYTHLINLRQSERFKCVSYYKSSEFRSSEKAIYIVKRMKELGREDGK